MSAVPKSASRFSAQDYFAWEAQQATRHEYFKGEVFAMAGAGRRHNLVSGNVFAALQRGLQGTPCETYASDMRLELDTDQHYVYPDVFVTCDPRDLGQELPEESYFCRFPRLVVEVLSPSTANYDKGDKFDRYREIETLEQVLFIDPNAATATLYTRQNATDWLLRSLEMTDTIALALGVHIPMRDVFTRVLAVQQH